MSKRRRHRAESGDEKEERGTFWIWWKKQDPYILSTKPGLVGILLGRSSGSVVNSVEVLLQSIRL